MRATIYALLILILAASASAATIMPVKCNDGTIEMTDTFEEGDDICVYGTGFEADEELDLYVVTDKDHYYQGEDYQDESGAVETATTNSNGVLGLKKLCSGVLTELVFGQRCPASWQLVDEIGGVHKPR